MGLAPEQIYDLVKAIDSNGDGLVSIDDFKVRKRGDRVIHSPDFFFFSVVSYVLCVFYFYFLLASI